MHKLYSWLAREGGQTMTEYAVVLTVISISVFTALTYLSSNIFKRILTIAGFIS